jgi:hypothetical protein
MRSGRSRSLSHLALVGLLMMMLAGCDEKKRAASPQPPDDTWEDYCEDRDGDGHGFQCAEGPDCDDTDPTIFAGCNACKKPDEGCECTANDMPLDCVASKEVVEGSLLCKTGTRYCRDGKWSGCEGLTLFEAPPPSRLLSNALIDPDAAIDNCSNCRPDCYRLEDPIGPLGDGGDAGVPPGTNLAFNTTNGGITLNGAANEAGIPPPIDQVTPVPPCDTRTDTDCDGVPNPLDPYPAAKPFVTDHTTIFMDLPPGVSASNTFDVRFYLNTADIYFLIDMTGSMSEEKTQLINSLTSGNYLNDPATTADESAGVTCSDRNGDDIADNGLKTQGITGNIACLIRSSGFGLGWFREIPFSANDNYGINYSYPDFEAYEHRQDISDNVTLTSGALNLLYTRGNQNWAESAGVALSAVATGGQIYMGWDRPGIPRRICPTGHYGYPCFRDEAIPIVVLITDAPMMNGPVPTQGHLGTESSSYSYDGVSNLQPVNYQPNGLRYTSNSSDAMYHPVTGNEDFASAYDVGVVDDSFKTYTGDTRKMAANIHAANLGITCPTGTWPSNATSATALGYPDAVFKFTVQTTKTLTVSTRGTRHQPSLAIVPSAATATPLTTITANGSNHNVAGAQPLGALGAAINLRINGDTSLAAYATGNFPTYAMHECFRGTGGTTLAPDAVYSFTVAQDVPGVTFSADGGDFDAVLALYDALPTAGDYAISNTNDRFWDTGSVVPNATTPAATTTTPGSINNRTIWMRGGNTNASGINYHYPETFFRNVSGDTTCDGVDDDLDDMVFDFTVTGTGTRTITFETTHTSDPTAAVPFDHVIALLQRPATSGSSTPSAASYCNRDGAGTDRASISRALSAGTYSLVLRGEQDPSGSTPPDGGEYGLIMRDTTVDPRACHNESTSKSFTTNLRAGVTYYLVVRGRNTASSAGYGSGPYTININNVSGAGTCAYDNTSYAGGSGDSSRDLPAAEVTATFTPGTYYAVLKGNANNSAWDPMPPASDTARGWYQLTVGDPTRAVNNQVATMPQWGTNTTGILGDLKSKNIHVITVASTLAVSGYTGGSSNQNTALRQQGDSIATSTGAVSTAGTPLRFDISNNGSGMGFAVVDAINKLAKNLTMDVSVRYVPSPDQPTAPQQFIFTAQAIDTGLTDLCASSADSNGDGVLDTHLDCRPGATPRFAVSFTNPPVTSPLATSRHVRPNGTKRGYDMRIELIGDGQYVVDSIPVYIIPEDAVTDIPAYLYSPTGTYTQDVTASHCVGTERPYWESLRWEAQIPSGTSLIWRVCMGDSPAELDACSTSASWSAIANVFTGGSCATSSECMNGYCNAGNVCEFPERIGCSASADCGKGGSCVSNSCVWNANPISLNPALMQGLNGKKMARLQVQLNASSSRGTAPTITDLGLEYVCTPGE